MPDDRALRRLEELIGATVRTNFYKHGGKEPTFRSGGVPYISYKFDCREMELLRRSRLRFEVWVHSSRMEGVHLRGSSVARGGIRWSDRPHDFRAEVLGLVKTQIVKNAVIVPGGSKGGFVTRFMPSDPEQRWDEGRAQYQTLTRGLLDLTDNLSDGKTVPPDNVVVYDAADPYLVGRGRQGHRDLLGPRELDLVRVRFLARRRVRVWWFDRLRPQGGRHHCTGRVGVREASLPREGEGHPERALQRGGHR